jgi:universal stress protein E
MLPARVNPLHPRRDPAKLVQLSVMQDLSRILCIIDPTVEEQPALERSSWIARHTGASLHLLLCYYNEYLAGNRFYDASSLERLRDEVMGDFSERLERFAEPLRNQDLSVTTQAIWGHPLHDCIARVAAAINADLVFKDTHHHSALLRGILTNTDWNLMRTCASPLWFVKPFRLSSRPLFLSAVDPMNTHDKPAALDDKILKLARSLSVATHGELHAFHAYDPRLAIASITTNAYVPTALLSEEIENDMRARHDARFRELTDSHKIPEAGLHLVSGLAYQELPALAEKLKATVVVMGAVARNRLKRIYIGSTAERTLEHLPCDLLVVKPDWYCVPAENLEETA